MENSQHEMNAKLSLCVYSVEKEIAVGKGNNIQAKEGGMSFFLFTQELYVAK